jgi:hypothetical protein
MDQKISLTHRHVTYRATQLEDETGFDRLWFIAKQTPKDSNEYHLAHTYSIYYHYKHLLGCEYHQSIERQIAEIEKNILYI